MKSSNLIITVEQHIAKVTVNRPEARNALDADTWSEIDLFLDNVVKDKEVRIIIFTGSGDKAFIAGADIHALQNRSMIDTINSQNFSILNKLAELDIVTIAAINGYALGGGCELAMTCDLRIADENARLGQPELGLGILPGAGGTQRLSRLVGPAKAKELILTGAIIDAHEALRIGLVNQVVEAGQAVKAAEEVATKILNKAPLAVRLCKIVVDHGMDVHIKTGLLLENLAQTAIFGTDDRKEGLSAFLEKRSPEFKGQ